MNLAILAW